MHKEMTQQPRGHHEMSFNSHRQSQEELIKSQEKTQNLFKEAQSPTRKEDDYDSARVIDFNPAKDVLSSKPSE